MNTKDFYREHSYTWQSNKDVLFENALRIQFESAIEKLGPMKSDEILLDVGCGKGDMLDYYQGMATYLGIDISQDNIVLAKGSHPEKNFKVSDAVHTGLLDSSISAAVCIEVLEHLPIKEIDSFLLEMARVLVRGGRLVVVTPNLLYLWGLVPWSIVPLRRRLSIHKFIEGVYNGYVDENYTLPVRHFRFLPSYLRNMCSKYFNVESVDTTFWYNNRAIHHILPDIQLKIQEFSARHGFLGLNAGIDIVISLLNK